MNNEGYVYDFKIELVNSPKKHLLKILDNIEKIVNILESSSGSFLSELDVKLFLLENKNKIYEVLNGVRIDSIIDPLAKILKEKSKNIQIKIDNCSISKDRRIYLDTVGLVNVCDVQGFAKKLELNKAAIWERTFYVRKERGKYYVSIKFSQPLEEKIKSRQRKKINKKKTKKQHPGQLSHSSVVFLKTLKALANQENTGNYRSTDFSRLSGHQVSGGLPSLGRNR